MKFYWLYSIAAWFYEFDFVKSDGFYFKRIIKPLEDYLWNTYGDPPEEAQDD